MNPSDEEVFRAVERLALALDAFDRDPVHRGAGFRTEEREQLCEYVDLPLGEYDVTWLLCWRGRASSEPGSPTPGATGDRAEAVDSDIQI